MLGSGRCPGSSDHKQWQTKRGGLHEAIHDSRHLHHDEEALPQEHRSLLLLGSPDQRDLDVLSAGICQCECGAFPC